MDYLHNNRKISYQISGGGDRCILLVHDIGGSSRDLEHLISRLGSRAKIVTLDLCGHGESDLPDRTVSLRTIGREIVAFLLDNYIGRVNVVALGVGGAIALEAFRINTELFDSFVFLDTFIVKDAWKLFSEQIRPVNNDREYKKFQQVFRRWIPAYRDDFFIFCSEFDGRQIVETASRKMLFVYGDRDSGIELDREQLGLPARSNISVQTIRGADRWMLETHYAEVEKLILNFLFDYDGGAEGYVGDGSNDKGDSGIDINSLMFLR